MGDAAAPYRRYYVDIGHERVPTRLFLEARIRIDLDPTRNETKRLGTVARSCSWMAAMNVTTSGRSSR